MKMFSVEDIVWAKSAVAGEIFWPAKVIESDRDLEDRKPKKQTVAYVNFLAEDTYEAIKTESNVQPFCCKRKEEFLRKGRNSKKAEKRWLFEAAVKEAEKSIKMHKKQKNTPKKYSPDTKRMRCSPRTRSCNFLGQATPATSILNKSEKKANGVAKTICSLPTIFEDSNEFLTCGNPTSMKQNETSKLRRKIVTKRRKLDKYKCKIVGKEEDVVSEHIEKGICNENKAEVKNEENCDKTSLQKLVSPAKDSSSERNESSIVSSPHETGSRTRSNSSCDPSTTRRSPRLLGKTFACCRESELKETTTKVTCSAKPSVKNANKNAGKPQNKKRFKKEIQVRLLKKFERSSNGKLKFSKAKDKAAGDQEFRTISEECEIASNKMALKRTRNKAETCETLEKDDTAVGKATKRARIAPGEERSENTNKESYTTENEKKLLNQKSGPKRSSRQNKTAHGKESYLEKSNDVVKTVHCDTNNTQMTQSVNDPEHVLKSQWPQFAHNGCDGGQQSEKAQKNLKRDENESRFDNLVEEKESEAVGSNKSDMEGNENGEDCSSDDESLPEAFATSPGAKKNFLPGDVVWVKHMKFPFWPAQISREACRKKTTHTYVKFLPKSGCKGMKVPKKNVKLFTEDHETYLRYKNQEIDSSLREDFDVAVDQAHEILVRRVFQKDEILPDGDEDEDEVSDVSEDDDEAQSPTNNEQDKLVGEADKPDEKPDDGESGFDSSEMEMENEEMTGNDESRRTRKAVTKYSNILNELHWCKQRLIDVYREKVPSSRHNTFKYGAVSERNDLKHRGGFGPVQDEETREEIIRLLHSWYDAEANITSLTVDYVFDVWLPEAMIHYIKLVDNLSSAEDAEIIYRELSRYVDKRDVEETRKWFKKTKIDEETKAKTIEKAKRKLIHAPSR